jgi:hypothetical protein
VGVTETTGCANLNAQKQPEGEVYKLQKSNAEFTRFIVLMKGRENIQIDLIKNF